MTLYISYCITSCTLFVMVSIHSLFQDMTKGYSELKTRKNTYLLASQWASANLKKKLEICVY